MLPGRNGSGRFLRSREKKGSLNLTVQQTDEDGKTTPLTGVKLELYRVADVSFDGNVHFVLTSSMSSAGYDFDSFKNASEWYSAAEKLAEVAAASSVKPVEAVSDEQGKVVYSDMEEGMYLVIGAAESSVKVTPMLLTVPFASTEEGWIYDVQAYPKAEKSNTAGIIVEKRLYRINPNTFELDEITADDATYKVGLFLDKMVRSHMVMITSERSISRMHSQAKLLTVMFLEVPIMYSSLMRITRRSS